MIELWDRTKAFWVNLYRKIRANMHWKQIQEDFKKEVAWEELKGEAQYWGDKETVNEVSKFYRDNRRALEVRVRLRCARGFNTATGLLADFRKCYEETELKKNITTQENKEAKAKKTIEEKKRAFRGNQ